MPAVKMRMCQRRDTRIFDDGRKVPFCKIRESRMLGVAGSADGRWCHISGRVR